MEEATEVLHRAKNSEMEILRKATEEDYVLCLTLSKKHYNKDICVKHNLPIFETGKKMPYIGRYQTTDN